MPLVSVVVPIYNVEPYVRACLGSIAQQTLPDLEVIVVDDGSTDGSAAIAEEFARANPRFRVIRQPNGGLGKARNKGIEQVNGEFLAFVDGDDVLPRNAYRLLLEALLRSGSDFATGNVHRLSDGGATSQAPFLARAFAETRLATHVTRFRPLLEDRIVPNKLWRRSFWDEHGFRFPEGMLHEDIPVVVPAQFAARSVDVIADPVYLYRIREGADLSITQRRAEKRALLDRIAAIEQVLAHFDRNRMRRARRWYERSVVAHDLSYYLNVLDIADEDYRALFLERVNALLDRAGSRLYGSLLAIDRLKWHLVRHRLMPELVQVLRFQKQELDDTPPVRVRGRWYGDYPFRGDRRLRIPRSTYRLGRELALAPQLDELRFDGDTLRIEGYAFIWGIGAPAPGSQRVSLSVLRPGRLRAIRQRLLPVRMETSPVERPDAVTAVRQSWCDARWSGFVATLDARRLLRAKRWELYLTVRARGVTRRRARFAVDGTRALRAVDRLMPDGHRVVAGPGPTGQVTVALERRWASVERHSLSDGVAELGGRLRAADRGGRLLLELVGSGGSGSLEYPLEVEDTSFRVRIPLAELAAPPEGAGPDGVHWDLNFVDAGERRRLRMDTGAAEALWPWAGGALLLRRTRNGHAVLEGHSTAFIATDARWSDGELELSGSGPRARELVLLGRDRLERHAFRVDAGLRLALTPARVSSLAGELPLGAGEWDLRVRAEDGAGLTPVLLAQTLYPRLPLAAIASHKRFALGIGPDQRALLAVGQDLDDDEGGRFHQRRLRERAYSARRDQPLREAVVYASFGGRQYSDSPRSIHEELVRRGAPLEHLWLVRDGMCRVPATATAVREGSRDHYSALAEARYLVTNDRLPEWFARRPDQVWLQTWHGIPVRRLAVECPACDWQYLVSPARFASGLLRSARGLDGELLETGYPRDDVLFGPGRAELGRRLRERLGVPGGKRVVLYAPTYRERVVDSQGRNRLDLHLDLERLRRALHDEVVILFRKHHRIADAVPAMPDGFVRDASSYPDATELLLAVDVLVTDYSSIMFDFANTGRPMIFFVYDIDAERDLFSFDFEATVPGPLVRTSDELADALRASEDISAEHAESYRAFRSRFCELDDGGAAARVVERVF